MGIFVEQDGHNVKFFIQRDIPDPIQNALTEAILAEDGRIEAKVPIKGYVLIQPGSPEADRLQTCWKVPDRPDRVFVPFTWVDACREAGTVLKPIFLKDGLPLRINIHSSIANINSRESIANRIMHAGGDPTVSEEDATVILADPDTEVFQKLVKHFQHDSGKNVESHLWVKKSIDKGFYTITGNVFKNPGGRRAGDERTSFTEDDEANLCAWIASVIPYKESGGRTGNKIYQELVSRVNDPGWSWVARHTWQSWRERYKKNAPRLDEHIATIVNLHQPARGGKGQYGYIRQPEEKPKAPRKRGRKAREAVSADSAGGSPAGSKDIAQETEADWPIRVGEAPPPTWATRVGEEDVGGPSRKRARVTTGADSPGSMHEGMHPVDQGIQDIANEFQFLSNEVREWYDRTGDMIATRERFAKMRAIMNAIP